MPATNSLWNFRSVTPVPKEPVVHKLYWISHWIASQFSCISVPAHTLLDNRGIVEVVMKQALGCQRITVAATVVVDID